MALAGRISDVFGRRKTLLSAYAVFVIETVLIALSTAFGPFLVGRVLTAIGGGAMVPVALAAVADVYPSERRARAIDSLGALETIAWVWGPAVWGSTGAVPRLALAILAQHPFSTRRNRTGLVCALGP
jgi:MFS family permease